MITGTHRGTFVSSLVIVATAMFLRCQTDKQRSSWREY